MKIALIGYGKMGKMIEQIALSRGHEIVSIIDINNQQDFDSPEFASADVAIEFTAPQAAYGNYLKAWEKGVKVVSGSTGWMTEHGDEVRKACTEDGKTLFWASNFSIGVAIFSAVNRLRRQAHLSDDLESTYTLMTSPSDGGGQNPLPHDTDLARQGERARDGWHTPQVGRGRGHKNAGFRRSPAPSSA